MAASTMMDASYDRKRYVKPCACIAKLFQSQPPRARGNPDITPIAEHDA